MTPELIEAAARLCGWSHTSGGKLYWKEPQEPHCSVLVAAGPGLTDSGLIDLETHLLKRGWIHDYHHPPGFIWSHDAEEGDLLSLCHPDRATAACMAAQKELENDAK